MIHQMISLRADVTYSNSSLQGQKFIPHTDQKLGTLNSFFLYWWQIMPDSRTLYDVSDTCRCMNMKNL